MGMPGEAAMEVTTIGREGGNSGCRRSEGLGPKQEEEDIICWLSGTSVDLVGYELSTQSDVGRPARHFILFRLRTVCVMYMSGFDNSQMTCQTGFAPLAPPAFYAVNPMAGRPQICIRISCAREKTGQHHATLRGRFRVLPYAQNGVVLFLVRPVVVA